MAFLKTAESYAALQYPASNDSAARINIYCADNHRLYLIFRQGDSLPNASYNAGINTGVAYVPLRYYDYYIDLLRNEDPIRVTFNPDSSPPRFVVYASREPVGEGEM